MTGPYNFRTNGLTVFKLRRLENTQEPYRILHDRLDGKPPCHPSRCWKPGGMLGILVSHFYGPFAAPWRQKEAEVLEAVADKRRPAQAKQLKPRSDP